MIKNSALPVYYGSIVISHCEGNPQIFSGHSKSPARLFEWLYKQTQKYFSGYVYPVDSVVFYGENMTEGKGEIKMDITTHFVK